MQAAHDSAKPELEEGKSRVRRVPEERLCRECCGISERPSEQGRLYFSRVEAPAAELLQERVRGSVFWGAGGSGGGTSRGTQACCAVWGRGAGGAPGAC